MSKDGCVLQRYGEQDGLSETVVVAFCQKDPCRATHPEIVFSLKETEYIQRCREKDGPQAWSPSLRNSLFAIKKVLGGRVLAEQEIVQLFGSGPPKPERKRVSTRPTRADLRNPITTSGSSGSAISSSAKRLPVQLAASTEGNTFLRRCVERSSTSEPSPSETSTDDPATTPESGKSKLSPVAELLKRVARARETGDEETP